MSSSEGPSLSQARVACRSLVLQSLWGLVHEALRASATSLEGQLRVCTQADQRSALEEALTVAAAQSEALGRTWVETFMQRFDEAINPSSGSIDGKRRAPVPDVPARSELEGRPVLSLVSDDDLQDSLEQSRLAQRVSSRVDAEALAALRARFAELAGRAGFAENDHPLAPAALIEALDQAARQCGASRQARLLLLEELALDLPARWDQLIQDTNAVLIAQGILPRMRHRVRQDESTASSRRDAALPPGQDIGRPGAAFPSGPFPSARGMGLSGFGRFASHGFAASAGAAAASGLGLSGKGTQVEQLQGALHGARSGQAGAHQQVLQVLVDDQQLDALGTAFEPVRQPLLESLAQLQQQWQGEVTAVSLERIAEQLHRNGTVLDQVTADIVSMVFDYIDADRRLADSVKRQLLRLQVVAIKAALLDRAFFARRQHPLRRLIDVISDAGADPEADLGADSALLNGIRVVIDEVTGQFDRALEVFDEAIVQVQSLVEAEARRHHLEREQAEQQAVRHEAMAVASEQARTALAQRIDAQAPEEVRRFLLEHWSKLMMRARLVADPSSAERNWEVSLRTAELLLWSCMPKQADEIARLAQILPVMLRAIQQGMQAIDLPQPEREAFLSFLMQTHTREIGLARRRPPQSQSGKSALIRMDADGVVRFDPAAGAAAELSAAPAAVSILNPPPRGTEMAAQSVILSALVRGSRYELASAGGARQVKLAWISPARRLFIFSAHPEFNLTMAAEQVEQQLRGGQLRPVDPSPSVQNILERLMQPEPAQ
ncbi:MAG: hypothetical protein RLZ51_1508 [Pseudomonadota bacterium]